MPPPDGAAIRRLIFKEMASTHEGRVLFSLFMPFTQCQMESLPLCLRGNFRHYGAVPLSL